MRRDEPREVYLLLEDGERVDCLIEPMGPKNWQATPVRDLTDDDNVVHVYIDVLPAGGTVELAEPTAP